MSCKKQIRHPLVTVCHLLF